MFDPEKVERFAFRDSWRDPNVGRFVDAEDYDQLLELYRAVTKPLIDGKDFCIIGGEVVMNPRQLPSLRICLPVKDSFRSEP